MCEKSLREFVSDEMVEVYLIFLKSVKCNFINLSLYLKIGLITFFIPIFIVNSQFGH